MEEMRVRDKLNDEYAKAIKDKQTKDKHEKELTMAKDVENSMWG